MQSGQQVRHVDNLLRDLEQLQIPVHRKLAQQAVCSSSLTPSVASASLWLFNDLALASCFAAPQFFASARSASNVPARRPRSLDALRLHAGNDVGCHARPDCILDGLLRASSVNITMGCGSSGSPRHLLEDVADGESVSMMITSGDFGHPSGRFSRTLSATTSYQLR